MRRILSIVLFSLLLFPLYAQDYKTNFGLTGVYEGFFSTVGLFPDGFGIYMEHNNQNNIQFFNYQQELINGYPFLSLSEPIIYNGDKECSSIMILTGLQKTDDGYFKKYTVMYAKSSDPKDTAWDFFFACNSRLEERVQLFSNCSSYLVEKKTSYEVDNLRSIWPDTPWVENAPGYGIGEGFTMVSGDLPYLLLMNGYISMDKPNLYLENARVKQLKITGVETGKTLILEVLDTPHPQTIDISALKGNKTLRVEINDVYPGTRYEDTCLQYCVAWDSQIVPYMNY